MAAILVTTKKLIHRPFSSQLFVHFCTRVPNNSFTHLFSRQETQKHADFHTKKPPKTSLLKYPDFGFSGVRPAFHTQTEDSSETPVENQLWGFVDKNPSGENLADNPSGETLAENPSSENPASETPSEKPSSESETTSEKPSSESETPSEKPNGETPSEKLSGETPGGKYQVEKIRITLSDDGYGGTHIEYASTDDEFGEEESLKDSNYTMVAVELKVWVDGKVVRYHCTQCFEGNSEQVMDRLNLKKTEVPRDWSKLLKKDFKKLEFLHLAISFCKAHMFGGDTVAAKYEIDRVLKERFPDNSAELKYLRSVLPELYPEYVHEEDEEQSENLKKLGHSLVKKKSVIKAASTAIVQLCYPSVSGVYGVLEAIFPMFLKEKVPEQPKGKPEKKDYNKGMLIIMDAVGFSEEDIDITLGHNFLKIEGGTVTIRGGRNIDEEVPISEEVACDPFKVTAELCKGELLVFFPKDSAFTSFFKGKGKKGETFDVSWGDVKQYLIK